MPQRIQHLESVGDILEAELQAACGLYSEQKAIRVEKEVEFQKLSRLELKARASTSNQTADPTANTRQESESTNDDFEKAAAEEEAKRQGKTKGLQKLASACNDRTAQFTSFIICGPLIHL